MLGLMLVAGHLIRRASALPTANMFVVLDRLHESGRTHRLQ